MSKHLLNFVKFKRTDKIFNISVQQADTNTVKEFNNNYNYRRF